MTKMREEPLTPGGGGGDGDGGNVVIHGGVLVGHGLQPDVTDLPQMNRRRRRTKAKRKDKRTTRSAPGTETTGDESISHITSDMWTITSKIT